MESEKVKEIKKALEDNANYEHHNKLGYIDGYKCKTVAFADILTLINELESENELLRNAKVVYENVDYCAEDLKKAQDRIAELEKEIEENAFYSKGYAQGIKNTYKVVIPEKLKQFAERLKEEFIKSANIQDSITAKKLFRDICPVKVEKVLKKTLKGFINE